MKENQENRNVDRKERTVLPAVSSIPLTAPPAVPATPVTTLEAPAYNPLA